MAQTFNGPGHEEVRPIVPDSGVTREGGQKGEHTAPGDIIL